MNFRSDIRQSFFFERNQDIKSLFGSYTSYSLEYEKNCISISFIKIFIKKKAVKVMLTECLLSFKLATKFF